MNPYNNFYNPYSQPFQAAQGQFNQFPMSQPTQQLQAQQSGPAVLSVATIKQVEQVPVQPGRQVLVMVQNDPVIAMRTADQTAALQARVQSLELQQALCGVVRYPTSTTYATTCNPFFGGYSCGCNGTY